MFDLSDTVSLVPYQEKAHEILSDISGIIKKHTKIGAADTVDLFTVYIKKREISSAEALA